MTSNEVVVLSRGEVERLLSANDCVDAVEAAFRRRGEEGGVKSAVLGLDAGAGGFHVKAAIMTTRRAYFAAKVNANFPENPSRRGLPTIQGVLALFDAESGVPLALMDSIALTILRTAAATAVAARHLSAPGARTVTIVGCGAQAMAQLAALQVVRRVERVSVFDLDAERCAAFARSASATLGIPVSVVVDLSKATRASDIIITCTPSRKAFLDVSDVSAGAFVAAVGADNEHKQEIEPALLARAAVVADSVEQCAAIGDLHHAIERGVMTLGDVRAELSAVVVNPESGRRSADEIVVFDSTGVAFQDVAAAALVFERATSDGIGRRVALDR